MNANKSSAYRALENISNMMNYEILISRRGISDPDSDFIWASTFKAPVGISFIGENIFFNLFLPEDSEKDADKKLFLKRVEAKLQDGLWQVRRSMGQVVGNYGPALKLAVSSFRSAVLDYSYIEKGRTYVHFLFNEADLDGISRMILAVSNQIDDLRVEYLRNISNDVNVFSALRENEDVSAVTVEISPSDGKAESGSAGDVMFFVLGGVMDNGVKTLGTTKGKKVPEVLEPVEENPLGDGIQSFHSSNPYLRSLVKSLAESYAVIYASPGPADV